MSLQCLSNSHSCTCWWCSSKEFSVLLKDTSTHSGGAWDRTRNLLITKRLPPSQSTVSLALYFVLCTMKIQLNLYGLELLLLPVITVIKPCEQTQASDGPTWQILGLPLLLGLQTLQAQFGFILLILRLLEERRNKDFRDIQFIRYLQIQKGSSEQSKTCSRSKSYFQWFSVTCQTVWGSDLWGSVSRSLISDGSSTVIYTGDFHLHNSPTTSQAVCCCFCGCPVTQAWCSGGRMPSLDEREERSRIIWSRRRPARHRKLFCSQTYWTVIKERRGI